MLERVIYRPAWNVYFTDRNQFFLKYITLSYKNQHFGKIWGKLVKSTYQNYQNGDFDPGLQNTRPWQVAKKFPQIIN